MEPTENVQFDTNYTAPEEVVGQTKWYARKREPSAGVESDSTSDVSPAATKRLIKLTINVSSEAYTTLKEMAAQRGVTVTEMLRQAISTAKWVHDTTTQGEKILKQDRDGRLFEVVFR